MTALSLVAVVLALGLVPFALEMRRGRRRGAVLGLLVVWFGLTLAVGWAARQRPATPELSEAGRPIESMAETFEGSDACQACHPNEYATWHASYHRTMTQLATPDVVRGEFANVAMSTPDGEFRLEQRDDGYYANGRRVVLTTGSNSMQVYWASDAVGRSVSLIQAVYLIDEKRWIPRRAAFLQPPVGPKRMDHWGENCIFCHSTDGRPRLGDNVDTHVGEFGIACEACHGPAERHAARFQSPVARYASHLGEGQPDETIANPSRMSARLASHVCARCHANSVFTNGEQANEYFEGGGDPHRPGDDLEASGHLITGPDDPLAPADPFNRDAMMWPDGPARGSGREFSAMMHSACYGDGESPDDVSCLSCHRMHQSPDDPRPVEEWAVDQLGAGMDGDRACLQCHERIGDDLTGHTRHEAESSGSRCYNCHMPHTTYGLLKAIRSHYIASPDIRNNLESGRPNACNLCHLDKSLGWSAEHLRAWYGQPAPALTREQHERPASAVWLLTGDARQRALAAWHVGWVTAHEVSGSDWIAPALAPLLADPYPAVRVLAGRSLRTLPGYADFAYDDMASRPELERAAQRAWSQWTGWNATGDGPELAPAVRFDPATINRMVARRDDTAVGVTE